MSYEAWHWRVYNVLRRLFSLGVVAVGVGSCASAASQLLMPTPGDGSPTAWFAIGVVLVVAGVALCRLRSFRPDLGDAYWWERIFGSPETVDRQPTGHRSWWTGDPDLEDA